eukprot:scaffold21551_cov44-Prasinocladus_malaysianus.AAC.1
MSSVDDLKKGAWTTEVSPLRPSPRRLSCFLNLLLVLPAPCLRDLRRVPYTRQRFVLGARRLVSVLGCWMTAFLACACVDRATVSSGLVFYGLYICLYEAVGLLSVLGIDVTAILPGPLQKIHNFDYPAFFAVFLD